FDSSLPLSRIYGIVSLPKCGSLPNFLASSWGRAAPQITIIFRIISAMRRNTTQRNKTWRNTWAQFGIGAGALLLPPLVLGPAFYSRLVTREEEVTRPDAVRAAPEAPLISPPATVAAVPAVTAPGLAGKPAEEVAPTPERVSVQVSPVQVAATPAP